MSQFQEEVGALVSLRLRGRPPKGLPSERCAWLRGAIAARFRDDPAFHGHGPEGPTFRYPRVQYRWFADDPQVLTIGDTAEALMRDRLVGAELVLNGHPVSVEDVRWEPLRFALTPLDHLVRYRFVSPWLGLNQENHARYQQSDDRERRELLDRILRGNLLSMFSGFGWRVDTSDRVFAAFEPRGTVTTHLKDVGLIAFEGTFVTNWSLPTAIALGRSVSHGFGAIAVY